MGNRGFSPDICILKLSLADSVGDRVERRVGVWAAGDARCEFLSGIGWSEEKANFDKILDNTRESDNTKHLPSTGRLESRTIA